MNKSTVKICKLCAKTFFPTSPIQVYCNVGCRDEAQKIFHRERKNLNRIIRYGTCIVCGISFVVSWRNVKYCSDTCRDIYIQQNKKPDADRKCIICGIVFLPKPKTRLICSDKCYKKKNVVRQIEYQRKKSELLKIQKQMLEEQNKNDFFGLFAESDDKTSRNCSINDFEFDVILEQRKWNIKLCIISLGDVYNSRLHSGIEFDSINDALDFCYKIYKNQFHYKRDYISYVAKDEKMNKLIDKIKFPKYKIEIADILIKDKDYKALAKMLASHIKRKAKIDVVLSEVEIAEIVSDNYHPRLLEEYAFRIICEAMGL